MLFSCMGCACNASMMFRFELFVLPRGSVTWSSRAEELVGRVRSDLARERYFTLGMLPRQAAGTCSGGPRECFGQGQRSILRHDCMAKLTSPPPRESSLTYFPRAPNGIKTICSSSGADLKPSLLAIPTSQESKPARRDLAMPKEEGEKLVPQRDMPPIVRG